MKRKVLPYIRCSCGHEKLADKINGVKDINFTPELMTRMRCTACNTLGAVKIVWKAWK